jgi:hypothetical protein
MFGKALLQRLYVSLVRAARGAMLVDGGQYSTGANKNSTND